MKIDLTLNARNLLCPMPVIRLQNAIAKLSCGQTVEIWCTDPGTKQDIPTWCRINGHQLLSAIEKDNEFAFFVSVGES